LTVTVPVTRAFEHVLSVERYRWKVSVPVGELPPQRTAWSEI